MAATVSAWSKPGAWALDSEEHESELLQQQKEVSVNGNNHSSGGAAAAAGGLSDFPSLAAAVTTKTKKKKPQTISLQEFTTYGGAKPAQAAGPTKGLTPEEIMMLPSGPRQRSAEELDQARLGGGFRSYGASYDRPARGSDEPRRQGGFGRESNREFTPSRADETDDWGAAKKTSSIGGGGFERRERGDRGGFFSDSQSKADESDNWGANKSFVPSSGRRFDRKTSFDSNGSNPDSDNWSKKKEEEGRRFGSGGGAFDSLRERRGGYESTNGGVDSDNWGKKREETVSVGVGGGRPKLNLQPRTLPVGEVQQNGNGDVVKPKVSNNPFGAARPREEVLKEKGQDWKEIDQKLESSKLKEVSESADGARFAKKGFGGTNGKPSSREDKTEGNWRRSELNDIQHSSAEETVDGAVEETENGAVEESGGESQV